jgi:hypothetical protein
MLLLILTVGLLLAGCGKNNAADNQATEPSQGDSTSAAPTSSTIITPSTAPTPESSPDEASLLDVEQLTNTFAFADKDGKRLISIGGQEGESPSSEDMKEMNTAVGEYGQVLTIRYVAHQTRTDKDNGRQAANNFDNLEGSVYEVVSGKAVADASYYIIQDASFDLKSIIPMAPQKPLTPPLGISKAIAESHGREIASSWLIASTQIGQQIYLVQFERQEDQMLASLAVLEQGKWTFMDYPATYNENSTWRVDDQGVISPDMFSFLFAAKSAEGLVLGVKWMGAEGENLTLLQSKGDRFGETDIKAARYLSPI